MTKAEILAAARHGVTFITGGLTFLGAVHLLSTADAAAAIAAVNQITSGVGSLFVIFAPIGGIVMGWFASKSASPAAQIQSVNAGDNGVKVVSTASPSPAVNEPLK